MCKTKHFDITATPLLFIGVACAIGGFGVGNTADVIAIEPLPKAMPGPGLTPLLQGKNNKIVLPPPKVLNASFLVFSPDGKSYVADLDYKALALCDTITGKVLRRFVSAGHAVFSPDGKMLLTASHKGAEPAALLDVATSKEIRRLDDCYWSNQLVAFSPDGKLVAGIVPLTKKADNTNVIRFWDVASGKRLIDKEIQAGVVGWFAFSSDGLFIVVERWNVLIDPDRHPANNHDREWHISVNVYGTKNGNDLGPLGDVAKFTDSPPSDWRLFSNLFRACAKIT
ncbi:MAG TPA: hypothetical protein VE988_28415 [Gemmataceae bacterium]|nr:hypothetical protein [Gemmataceae bacterium]